MTPTQFQILMLFWNIGLVDTFNVVKICLNYGSQYISIVGISYIGNSTDLGIKTLLEPILSLGTSYQFVNQIGITAFERRQRIATLDFFLSASVGALTTDFVTNIAMRSAVESKTSYMKAILVRGGAPEIMEYVLLPSLKKFTITANPLKTPVLSPAQFKLQETGKIISQNIFVKHTNRRYAQGLAKKVVRLPTTSVEPLAFLASTGWTCFGIGISVASIYSILLIIQDTNKKPYQITCQPNEPIIDVTAIDIY